MNAAEERFRRVSDDAKEWDVSNDERRAIQKRLDVPWRSNGPILSLVFFVLTSIAVVATFFLFDLMGLPKGWATAIVCIGLAELLIRRFRFFGTGVEPALWLGGLFAWIAGLPRDGSAAGLLLFAIASAIAAARVRNPFIGALAAIFLISYLTARNLHVAAAMAGVIIAALALAGLAREWRRPSAEMFCQVLMIVGPLAGAISGVTHTPTIWSIAYVALGATEIAFGIAKRHRGALMAGAVSIGIAVFMLRDLLPIALEARLIIAGAILFGISVATSRALRGKTKGFVATPQRNAYEEWMRVFGTVAFAPPASQPTAHPEVTPGGGSFGGAGATGGY